MRRQHAFALAILVAAGVAFPAFAQTSPPASASKAEPYPLCTRAVTDAESEVAHQKYVAGKVDYDERNYESAIVRFREAYAKDCTKHELLVILSRAYEGKNDLAEAIRALETYLQRVKDAPDRSTYETRIANLKRDLGKQPPPTAPPAASASPSAATATATPTPTPSGTTPPTPSEPPAKHSVYPLLLGATGGVALTVGILLEALKPDLPPNCSPDTGTCDFRENLPGAQPGPAPTQLPRVTSGNETPSQRDQLRKDQDKAGAHVGMQTAGLICIIGGGALLVGAAVWFLVEPTIGGPPEKSQTTIKPPRPEVGPGYAGLSLGGSF